MIQKEAVPAGTEWIERKPCEFQGSPFDRIGRDWMLITAARAEEGKSNWNTMTASWGGFGVLWGMDVAFMFVRPSRHTFGFVNGASLFTLSFFDETYRGALDLCGEKSGRDIDKAAAAGLTPVLFRDGSVDGAVSFREARDVFVCKKLYTHDFDPALFLAPDSIENNYHGTNYHRMYIGEIVKYIAKR